VSRYPIPNAVKRCYGLPKSVNIRMVRLGGKRRPKYAVVMPAPRKGAVKSLPSGRLPMGWARWQGRRMGHVGPSRAYTP